MRICFLFCLFLSYLSIGAQGILPFNNSDLPVEEREEGTMVTTVYGVQKGCAFVRVHDVEKNKRAIRMTRALMREHEV